MEDEQTCLRVLSESDVCTTAISVSVISLFLDDEGFII